MDTLLSSANFWVLVSFVALFALFGRRIWVTLVNIIDERTQMIRTQLEEAQRLQSEAASLLQTYKAKRDEAVDQSIKIVSRAENEAMELQRSSEQELEHFIKLKEKAMEDRLTMAQKESIESIREEVMKSAFQLVENVLSDDQEAQESLQKNALKDLQSAPLKKKAS